MKFKLMTMALTMALAASSCSSSDDPIKPDVTESGDSNTGQNETSKILNGKENLKYFFKKGAR